MLVFLVGVGRRVVLSSLVGDVVDRDDEGDEEWEFLVVLIVDGEDEGVSERDLS